MDLIVIISTNNPLTYTQTDPQTNNPLFFDVRIEYAYESDDESENEDNVKSGSENEDDDVGSVDENNVWSRFDDDEFDDDEYDELDEFDKFEVLSYGIVNGLDLGCFDEILRLKGDGNIFEIYNSENGPTIHDASLHYDEENGLMNIFKVFKYFARNGNQTLDEAQKSLCVEIAKLTFQINGNKNDERCERLEELKQRYYNYLEHQLQV